MFLQQLRLRSLPSPRQPAINLTRKDTATVFQRHFALSDVLKNTYQIKSSIK